jgi:hypothetical protein
MTWRCRRDLRNAYVPVSPLSKCEGDVLLTMTTRKFKTKLESRVKKLLPPNTLPRKIASQLRHRIKDPRVDYRLYKDSYELYENANPPEPPRTRKDKLKILIWIVVVLLSFSFMFYFFSQTSIPCFEFGCP